VAEYVPDKEGMVALGEFIDSKMDDVTEAIADDARWYAHVRTGTMQESTYADTASRPRRVVSDSDHSYYNEVGTEKMAANPFLQPALFQEREL
jgi:hypothetical protein